MPSFSYSAYMENGSVETGAIDAASERDALRLLAARGRRAFRISASQSSAGRSTQASSKFDTARFARLFGELAVLLDAGLPFDAALQIAVESERAPRRKAQLLSVLDSVREGSPVATAFAALTDAPDVLAMLASGERGGSMALVCRRLAAAFEMRAARRSALIDALAYPLFLLIVMMVSLAVLAFVLVPAIEPIFEGAAAQKPLAIRLLSGLNQALSNHGTTLAAAAILVLLVLWLALRSDTAGRLAARACLALPGIGQLIRQSVAARYLATLSLLLGNGVPMIEALGLSRRAVRWPPINTALASIEEDLANGATLREAAKRPMLFDHASLSFIALGEEANALPAVLHSAAEALDRTVTRRVNGLLKVMTPALTITLGLLVGSLVISVMTAILSINDLTLQ